MTGNSPVQASSLSNVTAIAAGKLHGRAVKDNGTVPYYAWGDNAYGQIGTGTTSVYKCSYPKLWMVI